MCFGLHALVGDEVAVVHGSPQSVGSPRVVGSSQAVAAEGHGPPQASDGWMAQRLPQPMARRSPPVGRREFRGDRVVVAETPRALCPTSCS